MKIITEINAEKDYCGIRCNTWENGWFLSECRHHEGDNDCTEAYCNLFYSGLKYVKCEPWGDKVKKFKIKCLRCKECIKAEKDANKCK